MEWENRRNVPSKKSTADASEKWGVYLNIGGRQVERIVEAAGFGDGESGGIY